MELLLMTEPRQIEIARSLIGTHEGDNPVITGFARKIGELYPEMKSYAASYTSDGIAWCGVFVAYCMAMSGIRPVFGPADTDKWMWAQSWKQFGTATASPQIGDVLVLARHVTMYAGARDGRYIGLGGNQSDSVKESLYSPDSVEAIRRPPIGGTVTVDQRPEIKLGATGAPVRELQRLLGFLAADQDGEFGPQTEAAVVAFQKAHDLDADGEVGPLTWAALLGAPTPAPAPQPTNVMTSKGSWYSQYDGKYHWHDSGDAPGSAALGVPDDAQGIARPGKDTLGTWFMVRAPNGKVSLEIQTDLGPAAFTGRTIDISAAAAERFGYSPANFPTDSIFTFWPVDPPKEVAGLSKQQQAIKYRDIRKEIPMSEPQEQQQTPPASPPQLPVPSTSIPSVLKQFDVGGVAQRMDDPDVAETVIGIELSIFNFRHPSRPLYLGKGTAPPASAPSTAASVPALQRPSVLLSAGTLGITGFLQYLGHIPPPGAESLIGTLATLIPVASTVLGGMGGWGAIASVGLNALGAFAKATSTAK